MAVVVVCLCALGLAYYGKDSFYSFTADELEVVDELMTIAPAESLLVEATRNYPSQFRYYEKFTYVAVDRESIGTQLRLAANPADELHRWLSSDNYSASYLLLTRSQRIASEALGSLPPDFIQSVDVVLRSDERFKIILEGEDAVVFMVVEP